MYVNETCPPLGYYAASSGTTFRGNLSVPSLLFLTLEDGPDRLSRNVGKESSLLAA